jgi:hypothetical protein
VNEPADDNAHDDAPVPRPRPGYATPSLSTTLTQWAPVAAGVVRAVAGVIAFAAALLTLPIHFATPFLSGVGLLMLVGGCVSVVKACKDEPRLRTFSRVFPLACCAVVVIVVGVVAVYGPGAFAPNLRGEPAPPPAADDGTIRFQF